MGTRISPERLARLPRLTLPVHESRRQTACCICSGPIEPFDWYVAVDRRSAHTECAHDAGFQIKGWA